MQTDFYMAAILYPRLQWVIDGSVCVTELLAVTLVLHRDIIMFTITSCLPNRFIHFPHCDGIQDGILEKVVGKILKNVNLKI